MTIDAGLAPPATGGTAPSSFIDGLHGPDFRKTLGDYADAVLFRRPMTRHGGRIFFR